MPRHVYFVAANMPEGLPRSIIEALLAEKHIPIALPSFDDALAVLRREMPSGKQRYCVVRNPATSEGEERMWGFIISNATDPTTEFKESLDPGTAYCVMEFSFTDNENAAQCMVKPAPVFELVEGYEIPADGSIPWSALVKP